MRIKAYYNLRRNLFSVVALEGPKSGTVIAYWTSLRLDNVTFRVSEAGRQRVLKERRKNVHAFVVGDLYEGVNYGPPTKAKSVTYNPYKYSSFVFKVSEKPITSARTAWLFNKEVKVI